MRVTPKTGFTLVEILLVIAAMAVILGVTGPIYRSFQKRNNFDFTVLTLVQALHRAQILAQSGEGDSDWGVRIDPEKITLFMGSNFAARDLSFDKEWGMAGHIVISGSQEFVFLKISGELGTLTSGLIAHWKLDEGAGIIANDSAVVDGAQNGDLIGMDAANWVTGKVGGALFFDGVDDWVNVSSPSGVPNTDAPQTYAAWIRYSGLPGGGKVWAILQMRNGCCVTGTFISALSAVLLVGTDEVTPDLGSVTPPPSIDTWHHIAYTFDGTTNRFYVDGTPASLTTNPPASRVVTLLDIGADDFGNQRWHGEIDDIRIYNRALTAGEIVVLADLGNMQIILTSSGMTRVITVNEKGVVSY